MKTFKDLFGSRSEHEKRNLEMIQELAQQDLKILEGGLNSATANLEHELEIAKKATESIMLALRSALKNMQQLHKTDNILSDDF